MRRKHHGRTHPLLQELTGHLRLHHLDTRNLRDGIGPADTDPSLTAAAQGRRHALRKTGVPIRFIRDRGKLPHQFVRVPHMDGPVRRIVEAQWPPVESAHACVLRVMPAIFQTGLVLERKALPVRRGNAPQP